jgi:three-Cys-motif partner protein
MLDHDGLPLDEVGPWAKEKHERLRQYVVITREARRKFVEGPIGATYIEPGGATYIDLYCASGRSFIRDTGQRVDGSPLVALKSAQDSSVPFSEIYIADNEEELCRAAEKRLVALGAAPRAFVGPAEQTVGNIVEQLNPHGLHFAFLDPFNLQDLPFSVLETFSKLKRIDLLIHVSAQDLQRNLFNYIRPGDHRLEKFVPGWRKVVDTRRPQQAVRAAILEYWITKMRALGLPPARHAELISGAARNQRLYWLVLAARHDLARQLWNKIRSPTRQSDLFGG